MANESQVAMLKRSVEEWNAWRESDPDVVPDLGSADIRNQQLASANLSSAHLVNAQADGTSFTNANLVEANLTGAQLSQARFSFAKAADSNFTGSRLAGALFYRTDLTRASFKRASLRSSLERIKGDRREFLPGADLTRATLLRTNFAKAKLGEVLFVDVNLAQACGLDRCVHFAPSVLDTRTLQRSQQVPLPFLRGCGIPERLIDFLPSLLTDALQFYSCFVSYSTRDQEFANRLHADLQDNGVRCWFAPHDIVPGRKIYEQIDEAIGTYDRLLLILSEASMASEWVKTEIANARQKELRQGSRVLFPISVVPYEQVKEWRAFDADTGKDSAKEIREYVIPDFTNWKDHDAYKDAFDKLLKGLKAEASETRPPD